MPTPLYELQQYLKTPLFELRRARMKTVLWSIVPLCILMLLTDKINLVGILLFIGGLFMLPMLFDLPSIEVADNGITFKTLLGRAFAAWDSIDHFQVRKTKNSAYLEALVIGSDRKNFLLGFRSVKGRRFLSMELPPAFSEPAASRLNEFRRLHAVPTNTNRPLSRP